MAPWHIYAYLHILYICLLLFNCLGHFYSLFGSVTVDQYSEKTEHPRDCWILGSNMFQRHFAGLWSQPPRRKWSFGIIAVIGLILWETQCQTIGMKLHPKKNATWGWSLSPLALPPLTSIIFSETTSQWIIADHISPRLILWRGWSSQCLCSLPGSILNLAGQKKNDGNDG